MRAYSTSPYKTCLTRLVASRRNPGIFSAECKKRGQKLWKPGVEVDSIRMINLTMCPLYPWHSLLNNIRNLRLPSFYGMIPKLRILDMDDKITIIEGPPPNFEDVHEGWPLGLNESPSLHTL